MSQDKKSLVIRADGSKIIGIGHIMPMITLAHECKKRGIFVKFLTLDNPGVTRILTRENLPFKTISDTYAFNEIRKSVLQIKPAVIIVNTWRNENISHFNALKAAGSNLIGIYQTSNGLENCDFVINSLPVTFNKITKFPSSTRYYEGLDYLIFSKEERYIALRPRRFEGLKLITVAIGGTDTRNLAEIIRKNVLISIPNSIISVIKGGLSRLELFKLLQKSDLAITGGGNLVFESAFLGTPTLAIASEPWEINNIQYLEKRRAAVYLGYRNDIKSPHFQKRFADILAKLNEKSAGQLSLNAKRLIDGKGLDRTLKIIESAFTTHRP